MDSSQEDKGNEEKKKQELKENQKDGVPKSQLEYFTLSCDPGYFLEDDDQSKKHGVFFLVWFEI